MYNDILKSSASIATNILVSRLLILAKNKSIEKLDHLNNKAKKMYRITQKGIALLPIMIGFHLWGEKYATNLDEMKATMKEVKKTRKDL
jgi:DNA-binding HxlR family transcriptional regulator